MKIIHHIRVLVVLSTTVSGTTTDGSGAGTWTLPVLPDTQIYLQSCSDDNSAIVQEMIDFIIEEIDPPYIHQVGDLINDPRAECEWILADAIMSRIEDAGLSWGLSVGNHEGCYPGLFCEGELKYPLANFDVWFPPKRWESDPVFGGTKDTGTMENAWHKFRAGNIDWLVVNLGFAQPPSYNVLLWADALIKAHPDHRVIVGQHSLIWGDNTWTNEGNIVWNALKANPNLTLMFCGHRIDDEHGHRVDFVGDKQVHTIMINYQAWADEFPGNGGDGYMLLGEFTGLRVDFRTYSPFLDQESPHPEGKFSISLGPPGDVNSDGQVGVGDMMSIITQWGVGCMGCIEDVDLSGDIGIGDILTVIDYWGASDSRCRN